MPLPGDSALDFPHFGCSSLVRMVSASPLYRNSAFLTVSVASLSWGWEPNAVWFSLKFSNFSSARDAFRSLSGSAAPGTSKLFIWWPGVATPSSG